MVVSVRKMAVKVINHFLMRYSVIFRDLQSFNDLHISVINNFKYLVCIPSKSNICNNSL